MTENSKTVKKKTNRQVMLLCLFVIMLFVLEKLLLNDITKTEGVKIGLYNILIVFAVANMKPKHAFLLMFVKILLGLVLTSSLITYSLLGGLASIGAMLTAKKALDEKIGYLGLSIAGALAYNITVYIVAAISLSSMAVFNNLSSVIVLSVLYGGLTGALAYLFKKSNIIRISNG